MVLDHDISERVEVMPSQLLIKLYLFYVIALSFEEDDSDIDVCMKFEAVIDCIKAYAEERVSARRGMSILAHMSLG